MSSPLSKPNGTVLRALRFKIDAVNHGDRFAVDTNKIVAAIYAVNAEHTGVRNAAAFLLRYDEMLATLDARGRRDLMSWT